MSNRDTSYPHVCSSVDDQPVDQPVNDVICERSLRINFDLESVLNIALGSKLVVRNAMFKTDSRSKFITSFTG